MSYGGYRQQWGDAPAGNRQSWGLLIRLLPIGLALLLGMSSLARGCQRGPFGRVQTVGMSPQQESALGLRAAQEIRAKEPTLPRNSAEVRAVEAIVRRLIKAAEDPQLLARMQLTVPDFQWEVDMVRANTVNAFCLPGGKIFVYTGIQPVCENQDGMACVLGHEIAHALAHHGAERAAHQDFVGKLGTGFSFSVGGMDPMAQRSAMAIFSAGAKFGGLLPFSRKHESEADRIGLTLMSAAGFDPREAPRFWQRMSEKTGSGPAQWMSTHPGHSTRIRDLQTWLPEAMEVYDAYGRAENSAAPLPGREQAARDALRELEELRRAVPRERQPQPAGRPGDGRMPPPLG
jgi:metalloendopeptidase OMA1, mitochondrial